MYRLRIGGVALAALAVCSVGLSLRGGPAPGEGAPFEAPLQGGLKITTTVGHPLTEAEKNQVLAVIVAATKVDPKKVRLMGARLTKGDRDVPSQNGVAAVVHNYATHKSTRYVVDIPTGKIVEQSDLPGQPVPNRSEIDEAKQIIQKDATLAPLLKDGDLVGGFLVSHHHAAGAKHRLLQFQLLKKGDHDQLLRAIIVDMNDHKVLQSTAPPK
jgi:hypothetical protein